MTHKFSTFGGVFLPTFLSIVGVILFLRLGTIVGSAGVVGAIAIIMLAVSVTVATGLSLSSITTNIRIGAGGAYSIITKTLGLEVGGSVGIPLYIAQALSVALYILGFAEAWRFIFPNHPLLFVAFAAFASLYALASIDTRTAVRVQYGVFVLVVAALITVLIGAFPDLTLQTPAIIGQMNFWALFALFFPAVTGLMAGIGLSGSLKDPKRQIPRGVLSAIAITTGIYLLMVFWLALNQPAQLVSDALIMVSGSAFGPIVLIGILAATYSSALTTYVAAPRLLQAMAENRVVPLNRVFGTLTKSKVPRNAVLFTTVLIALPLLGGSLDLVAQILSMFFLIAYTMINVVVLIEQSLGSLSFRPTLRIPRIVPIYGAGASAAIMFLINPIAGVVAIVLMFGVYLALVKQQLKPKEGDVRSGLFFTFAEWAARKIEALPESTKHTWKPNVLLPVTTTRTLLGNFPLIKDIVFPNGTLTVLGLRLRSHSATPSDQKPTRKEVKELDELPSLVEKFSEQDIFTSHTIVDVNNYTNGICISLEAVGAQVFRPNMVFLPFRPDELPARDINRIYTTARSAQVGVVMLSRDRETGLGAEKDVHVWLPEGAHTSGFYERRQFDLAMILAYRLYTNWDGTLNVHALSTARSKQHVKRFVNKLVYEARFPVNTEVHVHVGSLEEAFDEAPQGDLHVVPVDGEPVSKMKRLARYKRSILFVADSSKEDILA